MGDSAGARWVPVVWIACIVSLTVLAYLPAFDAGFVWDDDDWLTENPAVVGDGGLVGIWTGVERLQYYPLLYTTFWLEYRLWGLAPLGYHVVNVLLHALNAALLGTILLRLRVPAAWWVALLFAVHPVHVESVAWVTELKNVLSGALALAAVLAFVVRERGGARVLYGVSLSLFAGSMLAKTATAPLPVVLTVVLLWCHGRLTRRNVVRLVPYFAVAAALAVVTVRLEQRMVDVVRADFALSVMERIAVASRALLFYPWKLIVPWPVIFNYPRWDLSASAAVVYGPVVLVAALVIAAAWLWRTGRRGPVLAASVYAAMILPALGFVDVYAFRYSFVADHFQYLASIGVLILIVQAARAGGHRLGLGPSSRTGIAAAGVLLLAGLCWTQARAYRDAPTLWRDTLAKNPDSWIGHHNLGLWLLDEGDAQGALERLDDAVRSRPDAAESYTGRGMARARLGDLTLALKDLDRAVELDPGYPQARLQRARVLLDAGRYAAALTDLDLFLSTNPSHVPAYAWRARAYQGLGRLDDALRDLNRAIELGAPAEAWVDRAVIHGQLGDEREALEDANHALELEPANTKALVVRGTLWRRLGELSRSCSDWERACELGDCGRFDRLCRGSPP